MGEIRKKRIMVFGLSADPPHLGHEEMAKKMIELGYADEVWFMPCGQHPFKKNEGKMASRSYRLAMTRKVVERLNRDHGQHFVCSPIEIRALGRSYTVDTIKKVAELNPEAEIMFLMGSDQLPEFKRWKNEKELRKIIYVYPRPGYPMESWYEGMTKVEGVGMLEAASTQVRGERMGGASEWQEKVAPEVQEYIEEHHIYEK